METKWMVKEKRFGCSNYQKKESLRYYKYELFFAVTGPRKIFQHLIQSVHQLNLIEIV